MLAWYAGMLAILNGSAIVAAGVLYFFGYSFENTFFIVMLLEVAFAFIFAGWEDVRSTPSFTLLAKILFKRKIGYSPERHREALQSANKLIYVGAALFFEAVLISLAIVLGAS